MLLRHLSIAQRKALLVLAYHMAIADGTVTESESALMDDIRGELGVGDEITPQEMFERPALDVFDTPHARATAALMILTLAYIDDRFPPGESEIVTGIAHDFGIDDDALARMKDWAQRNVEMRDDFDALLNELAG